MSKRVKSNKETEVNRTIDGDTAEGHLMSAHEPLRVVEKKQAVRAPRVDEKSDGEAEGNIFPHSY